jgi:hypothetical protein
VDAVYGPRPGPIDAGFSWPVTALEWVSTTAFGGEVTGRLYAAGALFLIGFAAMVLLRRARWYAQCLGGLVAMLNPWVYDRMVEGQWGLVAGAGGLFLWLAAWEELQRRPSRTTAGAVALVGAGTAAFAPHFLPLLVLLALFGGLATRVWHRRERLVWTAASQAAFAVLLLYGILPFFLGSSSGTYGAVSHVGRGEFEFFRAADSAGHGLLLDLIGLFGYWGERTGRFALATNGWSAWPAASLALVAAAGAGALLRRERAWLICAGAIGLALSASTALHGGASAAAWLADRLPLFGAYREPQKASVLWLLAVATLTAAAVEGVASRRGELPGLLLAEALALAALLPAGYAELRSLPGIVKPARYPVSWQAAADELEREVPAGARVVVLPWHLYQPLPFAGSRLAANPARVFFPGRLIVPDDPELPGEISTRHRSIDLAARSPKGCSLARAIGAEESSWALVLDTPGGVADAASLRRCGFALRSGGKRGPWVLELP